MKNYFVIQGIIAYICQIKEGLICMAKEAAYMAVDRLCRSLVEDARNGVFKNVYLLMGEETFYVDMVCDAIIENCIDESERDFNQIVCYGADVTVDSVVTAARRFPMFAERQLVVLKEAQALKDYEELAVYCQNPLESTVLVICLMGAKADKRKALYKSVQKVGVVVESAALREDNMPGWIGMYFATRGLSISPDAAALFAEFCGQSLGKIAVETDKMLKNLPEGTTAVNISDIEQNVGVSRQYSIFELTKALSLGDAPKALRIAAGIGNAPKFAMAAAIAPLYLHFNRLLRYNAFLMKDPRASEGERAALLGVNPYFVREYDTARRRYNLNRCMKVIALLKEYDFKGKGGFAGEAAQGELLVELITKILN